MSKNTKAQRQETVESLQQRLIESPDLYLTDFTGLDVERMTELRRRFRAVGVEYLVVKNTLMQRAMAANNTDALDDYLKGPTGMVLAGEHPIEAAKVLMEFRKEHERPEIKIGLLDGQPMTSSEIERLAKLPSREELLAQLAGTMQAPVAGFLGVMNAVLTQFAGAVEALRAQRSAESQ
jgi:large subunit ribosomal protein L10